MAAAVSLKIFLSDFWHMCLNEHSVEKTNLKDFTWLNIKFSVAEFSSQAL